MMERRENCLGSLKKVSFQDGGYRNTVNNRIITVRRSAETFTISQRPQSSPMAVDKLQIGPFAQKAEQSYLRP